MDDDEIMTAKEVAKFLKLHPSTVYKLVKQLVIPASNVGGSLRFNRKKIMALVKNKKELGKIL